MDPRLDSTPRDPRVGRLVLKATGQRMASRRKPTAAEVEAERPFWGPHPDPFIAKVEADFYGAGFHFLSAFLGACLGKKAPGRRALTKSFHLPSAHVPGWGKVADLFRSDVSPARLLQGWEAAIDQVLKNLWPAPAKEQAAELLALRTHWLARAGERVAQTEAFSWGQAVREMTASQVKAMEWTKASALVYATRLEDDARNAMRALLVASKQAGEGPQKLERRLMEKFSDLNRDWRRIAITEASIAATNGLLASVDPADGWEAVIHVSPKACPYCWSMRGLVLKVVSPDKPNKNWDTEIWYSKNNVDRSAHRYSRKLGRYREDSEMYKPCVPAHSNCGCVLTLRRAKK